MSQGKLCVLYEPGREVCVQGKQGRGEGRLAAPSREERCCSVAGKSRVWLGSHGHLFH